MVMEIKTAHNTCSNAVKNWKNGAVCNLQCKHVPVCISETFLPCFQCDAMFASSASLNRHRVSHCAAEETYGCNHCTGYFRLVDDLIRHSVVHTLDKKTTNENALYNSRQRVGLHFDQQSSVLSSQMCLPALWRLPVHDEQPQRHAELEREQNSLADTELVKQEIDSTYEDSSDDTVTECVSFPSSPNVSSSLVRDVEYCIVENGEKHNNDDKQLLAGDADVKVELNVDDLLATAADADDDADRELEPNNAGANGSSGGDRSTSHGCEFCGRTFRHVHSLKRHVAIHSSGRPFYCRHCSKTFETLSELERHELIHVARKPYVCMLCGASYRHLNRLEEHLRGHQQRPCNGKEPDDEPVTSRGNNSENVPPANSGSHESSVTEQQQRPNGTDETASSHVCSLCGRSFSCNASLRRHERIHAGGRLFSCHLCARTFKTEREMNRHKVRRHKVPVSKESSDSAVDEPSPAHVCSLCGRTFTCVTSLRRHERIHAGGRLFSCRLCARTFKTEAEMNKHNVRRHQVEGSEQPCLQDRADAAEDASPAHVCSLCGRSFTCVTSLRRHERIHAAGRLFSCQRCARTFKTETDLDRHEAQRHRTHASKPLVDHLRDDAKNSTFKCPLCGRLFSCVTSLRRHERIHARGRHFSCQHCSKTFKTGTDLDRHKVIHLVAGDKKPYKCPVCAKSFRHACLLDEHQRNHTGEKPLKCTDCNKSFRWFSNLRMHRRTRHHGNKKTKDSTKQTGENKTESSVGRKTSNERLPTSAPAFDCKQCLQTFDCLLSLKRHEIVHSCSADRPFVCQHCQRSFETDDELARHKQLHFSTKPYVCQDCGNSFAFAYRLDQHARIHSGVKPHSCDVCGKSFRWSSNLSHHKRTVHGSVQQSQPRENTTNSPVDNLQQQQQTDTEKDQRSVGIVGNDNSTATVTKTTAAAVTKSSNDNVRRIMCQICGGMFQKMAALRLHMMIHTGERPHVCQLCGKTFRTANSMHRHRLTHVGDRSFVCQQCGRSFTTALTLSRHKLIHSNDRKYQCKECGKSFNQPTGLYLHKRQHSTDKRFKCPQCDMAFNYSHCLSGHMRKHNNNDDVKRKRHHRRVVDSADLRVDEPATSTSTAVRDGSVDMRRRGLVGTTDPRDETFRGTRVHDYSD